MWYPVTNSTGQNSTTFLIQVITEIDIRTASASKMNSTARSSARPTVPKSPFGRNSSIFFDPNLLRADLTTWTVLLSLVYLFGLLSNGLLLGVILNQRKLRNGCGKLIAHLIAVSFLICGIIFPLNIITAYGGKYWFVTPHSLCTITSYLQNSSVYVANWSEAGLAVNRFIAIVFPHFYPLWVSPRSSALTVLFCWAISSTTMLPFCFGVGGSYYAAPVTGQCTLMPTGRVTFAFLGISTYGPYALVGAVVIFVFAGSGFFSGHGVLPIGRVTRIAEDESQTAQTRIAPKQSILIKKLRMARMLLISFLFGVACNLPIYIMSAWARSLFVAYPISRLLLASQCALNPLIFFAFNQDYRNRLKRIWRRRRISEDSTSGNSARQGGPVTSNENRSGEIASFSAKRHWMNRTSRIRTFECATG